MKRELILKAIKDTLAGTTVEASAIQRLIQTLNTTNTANFFSTDAVNVIYNTLQSKDDMEILNFITEFKTNLIMAGITKDDINIIAGSADDILVNSNLGENYVSVLGRLGKNIMVNNGVDEIIGVLFLIRLNLKFFKNNFDIITLGENYES